MTKKDIWQLINTATPAAVDLGTILLYGTITAWFQTLFSLKTTPGMFIIFGLFMVFTGAAYVLNMLGSEKRSSLHALFAYPAIGFGAVMVMMMLEAGGIFSMPDRLDEGIVAALLILFIILLVIFLVFALTDSKKQLSANTPAYFFGQLFTLAVIAVMIMLSGAYWEYTFFEEQTQSFDATFAQMLWAYPLFFVFFAGPRLLPLSKRFTKVSFISALVSIGYYVWHSITMIS